MTLRSLMLVAAGWLVGLAGVARAEDVPGSKDPALFTRMPHFRIRAYDEKQFDSADFTVQKGASLEKQTVEDHKQSYEYAFDGNGAPPSPLQIQRNYQNAALKIGGKVMWAEKDDERATTLVVAKDGKETWVELRSPGQLIVMTVVEREAMKQDVSANADALRASLAQSGHAEVPGIFFDFNKSVVKPESRPAIEEVVKLLKGDAALRVWVVGHTDYVGTAEANVALSRDRAAAVVKALVQAGIAAKRLTPFGNGPYAPVAANATDEGRAHNRRVELVAQPSP